MRALVVLAVAAALTGCGGSHSPSTRDRVSAYLARENAIDAQMQSSLAAVRQAFGDFARNRTSAATRRELANSVATFDRLRLRLSERHPPPAASKLHRLLLRLVTREATLTRELQQLTIFEPAFVRVLRPLAKANAATQSRLAKTKDPASVAATVRSYRAKVQRALRALRPLHPPALERPSFDAQVARLEALDAALGELATAAAAGDTRAAAEAEHEVSVASVSTDSRANQMAEQNAVRAYDRAVAGIATLSQKISAERDRLQIKLP